jgi:DNA polymerase-3 subunit alpha
VSLFREAFVENAALLTRDAILVVEGGLAWDDFAGALRIRARRVFTLNEACERQAKLLRIRLNGIGEDFLERLRDTLAGYRGGQTPLRVQYANASGHAEIELGPEWRVRATADLKRSLDVLPGVKSTEWVLGRSNGP